MFIHPTLYKRTSSGKVQIWWIEQDESKYRVHTGQIDGKITASTWKQSVGKNIGKANETTDVAQADGAIASEYTKKLNQGQYHQSIDTIDVPKYFAPMLAHPYKKYPIDPAALKNKNVASSPKLDGIRCIADRNGLWTRKGKPIVAMPHIWEAIKFLFDIYPTLILDGELYNHELRDRLNQISGLCRKTKLTEGELEETKVIQYHLYDCTTNEDIVIKMNDDLPIVLLAKDAGYTERYLALSMGIYNRHDILTETGEVMLVSADWVDTEDLLAEYYALYMQQGFEGQMIRITDIPYENKRSKSLLKRKEFIDQEFTIHDILEGVGNRSNMAGSVEYLINDELPPSKENVFSSGIAGGEDFYRHLWENKETYLGGQGNVRYFKLTEYGKPYLPVTHVVYEGKRDV